MPEVKLDTVANILKALDSPTVSVRSLAHVGLDDWSKAKSEELDTLLSTGLSRPLEARLKWAFDRDLPKAGHVHELEERPNEEARVTIPRCA